MITSAAQGQSAVGYTGLDELAVEIDADPRWDSVPRD